MRINILLGLLFITTLITIQPIQAEESQEILSKVYRKIELQRNDGGSSYKIPRKFREEYVNGKKYLIEEPEREETVYNPYYNVKFELNNRNNRAVNVDINIRCKYNNKFHYEETTWGPTKHSDAEGVSDTDSGFQTITVLAKQKYYGVVIFSTDYSTEENQGLGMTGMRNLKTTIYKVLDNKSCWLQIK